MVSFQCHGCGDVVKKPKLDQHRGRCHTGFDCIDCSTTFHGPNEYRGHTSCITEAEKYEKTVYKGPKTGAPPQNNYSNAEPATKGWGRVNVNVEPTVAPKNNYTIQKPDTAPATANGWGRGSGGSGSYPGGSGTYPGGRGGGRFGGRSRASVTGANDTPLGTQTRNSPEAGTPKYAGNGFSKVVNPATTNGYQTQVPVVVEPILPAASSPLPEKKKDKKRKSDATMSAASASEPAPKKSKINAASIPLPASPEKEKSKKDKKEKDDMVVDAPVDDEAEAKRKRKEEKRTKKALADSAVESAAVVEETKEERKARKAKRKSDVQEIENGLDEVEIDGKKRKRDTSVEVDKKKKKKKKSVVEEVEVEVDEAEAKRLKREKKEKKKLEKLASV